MSEDSSTAARDGSASRADSTLPGSVAGGQVRQVVYDGANAGLESLARRRCACDC